MVIFCCLTNILLITSLISLLSNTLTKVSASGRAARSPRCPIVQAVVKGAVHRFFSDPATSIYSCECMRPDAVPPTNQDMTDRRRYAVYVLEASTSNRLTYFLPPLVSESLFLF
jgi:hypothetical protein